MKLWVLLPLPTHTGQACTNTPLLPLSHLLASFLSSQHAAAPKDWGNPGTWYGHPKRSAHLGHREQFKYRRKQCCHRLGTGVRMCAGGGGELLLYTRFFCLEHVGTALSLQPMQQVLTASVPLAWSRDLSRAPSLLCASLSLLWCSMEPWI